MNIFVLNKNHPQLIAQDLCDIHLNKMYIESMQLLCTYYNRVGYNMPYKSTHINHPCSKWLRENHNNVVWLYDFAWGCSEEWKYRFGKIHGCDTVLQGYLPLSLITDERKSVEQFTLVMPEEFRSDDAEESYNNYYEWKCSNMKVKARWTKRLKPSWFKLVDIQ